MATKTYRGSCHCGRVAFEADVDLAAGTGKCNCTYCWKHRLWGIRVAPAGLRPQKGEDDLSRRGPDGADGFCRHCGVLVYRRLPAADWNDGAFVSLNLATL